MNKITYMTRPEALKEAKRYWPREGSVRRVWGHCRVGIEFRAEGELKFVEYGHGLTFEAAFVQAQFQGHIES